jgi:hypothetical protein
MVPVKFQELLLVILDFVTLEYQEIQGLLKDRHHRRRLCAILLQFLHHHQLQDNQEWNQNHLMHLH